MGGSPVRETLFFLFQAVLMAEINMGRVYSGIHLRPGYRLG